MAFLEIASKYDTDKVTKHQFHFMYGKYLDSLRGSKVKLLEIGLGCDVVRFHLCEDSQTFKKSLTSDQ